MSALDPTEPTPAAVPDAAPSTVAPDASRLAPPLAPPPADLRLLAGALFLLLVMVLLLGAAAARLRRRPGAPPGLRQAILSELERTKAEVTCSGCRWAAGSALPTAGQRPCAERVRGLLVEFAATVTGLPCAHLTTQELQACQPRLAGAPGAAFARLLEALAGADEERFGRRPVPGRDACLVDTAIALVRDWPLEPATASTPAGSRALP